MGNILIEYIFRMDTTTYLVVLAKANESLKVVSPSNKTSDPSPAGKTPSLKPSLLVLSVCIYTENNFSDLIRPHPFVYL